MVLALRFSTRVTSGARGLSFELDGLEWVDCSGEDVLRFWVLEVEPDEEGSVDVSFSIEHVGRDSHL